MGWFLLILLIILIAAPFIAEHRRQPMDDAARKGASGKFTNLPSGLTHYQWHGPQNGPTAVCVHGLATPGYVWDALVTGLNHMGYRVLTYDLYGRGYSDRVAGPQDAEFFMRQLEELLEDQGVDGGIMMLGYSMGGAIATCYGAKHPEMLERLILLAPAGLGVKPGKLYLFITKTPIIGDWIMLVLGGWFLRKGLKVDANTPSEIPDIYAMQKADTYVRGFLPAILSSQRNLLTDDLVREHKMLAKASVPVAAIWGEADAAIPLSGLGKLTEINHKARQTMIPDAPHSLPYTYPKEVIKAIQEFLREV
ncbi:alpha/beta fold hydrolase [Profundibacter sp.]